MSLFQAPESQLLGYAPPSVSLSCVPGSFPSIVGASESSSLLSSLSRRGAEHSVVLQSYKADVGSLWQAKKGRPGEGPQLAQLHRDPKDWNWGVYPTLSAPSAQRKSGILHSKTQEILSFGYSGL